MPMWTFPMVGTRSFLPRSFMCCSLRRHSLSMVVCTVPVRVHKCCLAHPLVQCLSRGSQYLGSCCRKAMSCCAFFLWEAPQRRMDSLEMIPSRGTRRAKWILTACLRNQVVTLPTLSTAQSKSQPQQTDVMCQPVR